MYRRIHVSFIRMFDSQKLHKQTTSAINVWKLFTEEVEELSGRLKASRQRVADLERSFTTASTSSNKHEQVCKNTVLYL